jgi:DNA-binding GntR family transcriptional regulator
MPKLEHRTLNDRAYDEIKKSLISGTLRSGQVLVIRTLAETYGISTTPVREALQRLVAERLLEMLPNRSIVVPYLSVERFVEIFQIRRQLEGFAAQLACERIKPTHITRLKKLVDEMDRCLAESHGADYQVYNQKFHFTIYELANSQLLLQLIGDMWTQVGPFFSELTDDETYFGIANDEHKRIVQAVADKDFDAVVKHLKDDISIAADHLVERLKNMSRPAA